MGAEAVKVRGCGPIQDGVHANETGMREGEGASPVPFEDRGRTGGSSTAAACSRPVLASSADRARLWVHKGRQGYW